MKGEVNVKIVKFGNIKQIENKREIYLLTGVEPPYIVEGEKEKKGIVFVRNYGCGDQLDHWTNHSYYIAYNKKTRKVLGVLHIKRGWNGTFVDCWIGKKICVKGYREFEKKILEKGDGK